VSVCDPYVDSTTLDLLASAQEATGFRILTAKVQNARALKSECWAFAHQQAPVEVRIALKATLHDRYVISDSSMLYVGHSLKDIGSREAFIIQLGEDVRDAMVRVFETHWLTGNAL
jgi:hypothetical protein